MNQGQSSTTIDKERRIASALSIGMKIVDREAWNKFTYFHFDANSGCGWNDVVGVDGSPVVFHKMADIFLANMKREAFFCDIDRPAIEKLLNCLGTWNGSSYLFHKDNEEILEVFAERLRTCGENPLYIVGSIIVDPNGYWYRSKGKGPPIKGLLEFVKEFPRVDIILNLNTRWRRLALAHEWYSNDIPPREVLTSLRKKHWLISRAQYGGDEFMLAVGRNFKTGSHRAVGFHELESEEGRCWMNMFDGKRQGEFPR